MAMMGALTSLAAEIVSSETVHFGAAVMAGMRPAEGGSESEANHDPTAVVVRSEAKGEIRRALSQASDSLAEAAKR